MSVFKEEGIFEEESQRILFIKTSALEEIASIAFKHKCLQAGRLVS